MGATLHGEHIDSILLERIFIIFYSIIIITTIFLVLVHFTFHKTSNLLLCLSLHFPYTFPGGQFQTWEAWQEFERKHFQDEPRSSAG